MGDNATIARRWFREVWAAGGERTLQVAASSGQCGWTATPDQAWISVVSGGQGRGNGTVTLHVDAVTGPPRTGNVTIAGQTVQVDQGTGCATRSPS